LTERRTITLENAAGVLAFVQIPALVTLPSVILWRGRAFYFVEDELYTEADCYDASADPVTTTAPNGERADAPTLLAFEPTGGGDAEEHY